MENLTTREKFMVFYWCPLTSFRGRVQNALDAFLLSSYTEGSKEEHEFLEALREYAGLNHPLAGNLVNVFYNISNVESRLSICRSICLSIYRFLGPSKGSKLPKSLSSEEMKLFVRINFENNAPVYPVFKVYSNQDRIL